eukprot:CAMPEP_0203739546 /NCGR_PEP_ID=MMETSP0092-20131115/46489_1 /ASSEMBLY_ACC=CAM_ASM_001090 /TAXON_ID=426623 /ORGANISM="Chaetoceros affinis, Strain CCMP159" /LENGTH=96 /DNA_ID=CAMNT_0050625669 /DNA_START=69 /DNA_END=356 /DNA_ORIENTATION=+
MNENNHDKRETTHVIDRRSKTPLNACSLEVLKDSIKLKGNDRSDKNDDEDERVIRGHQFYHPLVIGCYELNENNDSTQEAEQSVGGEQDEEYAEQE